MRTSSGSYRPTSTPRARRKLAVWALVASACTLLAAPAARADYAPLDQPGAPLDVPQNKLAAAVVCSSSVGHSHREPVLLVPGTGETFNAFFAWNYATELTNLGIPWCGVSPPYAQLGDTQTGAEYDAYAIRLLYRRSGRRKIAIVGHSQGGMQPRWALRFWPDTRAMVADVVGIAPDNQGTVNARVIVDACAPLGECPLNFWQAATGSHFIQALNSRQEMFGGIAYTVIYSNTDSVVEPQDTPLDGPGNYRRIALQDLCPLDTATHLQDGSTDPVSWALMLDAITHPGPADPSRIPSSVCGEGLMPGLTVAALTTGGAEALLSAAESATTAPLSSAEPPLACYVHADCTGHDAPTLKVRRVTTPRRIYPGRRAFVSVWLRVDEGGAQVPAPGVTVRLNGRGATTDARGHATVAFEARRPGRYRLTATRSGCNAARVTIRIRRPTRGRAGR